MVASENLFQTIVQFDKTIVLPLLVIGSIYDYLFCYCPLVGIIFEVHVLRITNVNNVTQFNLLCICDTFKLKSGPYEIVNTKLKPM